jgi:hypothetical protein
MGRKGFFPAQRLTRNYYCPSALMWSCRAGERWTRSSGAICSPSLSAGRSPPPVEKFFRCYVPVRSRPGYTRPHVAAPIRHVHLATQLAEF